MGLPAITIHFSASDITTELCTVNPWDGDFFQMLATWIANDAEYWPRWLEREYRIKLETAYKNSGNDIPKLVAAAETVISFLPKILEEHNIPEKNITRFCEYLGQGVQLLGLRSDEVDDEWVEKAFVLLVRNLADAEQIIFVYRKGDYSETGNARHVVFYDENAYYFSQYLTEEVLLSQIGLESIAIKRFMRYLNEKKVLNCNTVSSNGYKKSFLIPTGESVRGYVFARELFDDDLGICLYERGGKPDVCL